MKKLSFHWQVFIFILLLVFILLLLHISNDSSAATNWQEEAAKLNQEYGVSVVFDVIEFPTYWKAWKPEWANVPEEKRAGAIRKLRIDLSHYDPRFLRKHLTRIYLLTKLTFNEQEYGGTNDHINKWLYLHVDWLGDSGKHNKAMGFHHEFSSILFKLYQSRFDTNGWRKLNPPTFNYSFEQSRESNIQTGRTGLVGNEELYKQGFLCSYGSLTLEDDINTYAQYLIAKPESLKNLTKSYPRIQKKVQLLSTFIQGIGFTFLEAKEKTVKDKDITKSSNATSNTAAGDTGKGE